MFNWGDQFRVRWPMSGSGNVILGLNLCFYGDRGLSGATFWRACGYFLEVSFEHAMLPPLVSKLSKVTGPGSEPTFG